MNEKVGVITVLAGCTTSPALFILVMAACPTSQEEDDDDDDAMPLRLFADDAMRRHKIQAALIDIILRRLLHSLEFIVAPLVIFAKAPARTHRRQQSLSLSAKGSR